MSETVLKEDEKIAFALRSLYRKYGYLSYKMSKFEEYDLYVRNKDCCQGCKGCKEIRQRQYLKTEFVSGGAVGYRLHRFFS